MIRLKHIVTLIAFSIIVITCATNPITGRKSFQLVSDSEIANMALQQYKETLSKSKVVTGTKAANQIKNVGMRLQNAASNYYKSIGREADLANYNWEYNLVEESSINAWCMPGGKVVVYTGILPITKDDAGMAVVLGHEISHALAGHGNERISQGMLAQYGGAILGGAITNSTWNRVFQEAYPIGAQAVTLKFGRSQELEADQMGLMIMAMGGFDPRAATPFWQRMENNSGRTQRPPEFLSTHPNPENRIAHLQELMPKALEYYKIAGGKL